MRKRKPIPHKEFTAGILLNNKEQLLLVQRPAPGLLGGLWKFPGGERMNNDMDMTQTLRRTIQDEVGICVKVGQWLCSAKHAYSHFKITLHAFECTHQSGEPAARGCQDWQWVDLDDLHKMPLSRADRKIIEAGLT
jgi:A/G-specific adenine glycosylase